MHKVPQELKYLATHEWLRVEGNIGIVGITDHAQDALGDVVYVDLPEMGADVQMGQEVAVIESVKAASDIYAPVSGKIIKINERLKTTPELVNQSNYSDGWLFHIELADTTEIAKLLNASQYEAMTHS